MIGEESAVRSTTILRLRAGLISLVAAGCSPMNARAEQDGAWVERASLNIARQECNAARIGENVYVVGGLLPGFPLVATDTVEAYHIPSDTWTLVAPAPVGLDHMAVAAMGGKLYVMGGYAADFNARDETWIYDPTADAWSAGAPLPSARGACWSAVHDGRIYVFGGANVNDAATRSTFVYDPIADAWSTGADMPVAGEHLTAVAVGDFIYVIGGRNGSSTGVNQRYDPAGDSWELMATMPTARAAPAAAAFGHRIHVAGGETPRLFDEHEVYDTIRDTWDTAPAMPVPRHGLGAVALDDRILFPGGAIVQGFGAVSTVDSFVPALPSGVPTLSQWSVVTFLLSMLIAATVVLRPTYRHAGARRSAG
jgi:hypothetical protein